MHPYRTHIAHSFSSATVGGNGRLSGWIHRKARRTMACVLFIDLARSLRPHLRSSPIPAVRRCQCWNRCGSESVYSPSRARLRRALAGKTARIPALHGRREIDVFALSAHACCRSQPARSNLRSSTLGRSPTNSLYPEGIRLRYRFLDTAALKPAAPEHHDPRGGDTPDLCAHALAAVGFNGRVFDPDPHGHRRPKARADFLVAPRAFSTGKF